MGASNKVAELRVEFTGSTKLAEEAAKAKGILAGYAKSATQTFNTFGNKATAIFTAPMLAAGTAAFGMAEKVDVAQKQIRITTRATGEALAELEGDFKNVAKSSGSSFDTIGRVMAKFYVTAGARGDQLQNLTKETIKASKMMGEDAVPNAELFARTLVMWHEPLDQAEGSMNRLFDLARDGSNTIGGLLTDIRDGAPVLKAFGLSLDESAVMADDLKQAGIALQDVLPGIKKYMSVAAEAHVAARPAFDALEQRIRGAKTETEALDIAAKNFGTRNAVVMSNAIRTGAMNLGTLSERASGAVEDVNALAAETATFGGKMAKLGNQMAIEIAPAGEVLLKIAEDAVPKLSGAINYVAKLAKGFEELDGQQQRNIITAGVILYTMGPVSKGVVAVSDSVALLNKNSRLFLGTLDALSAEEYGQYLGNNFELIETKAADFATTLMWVTAQVKHDLKQIVIEFKTFSNDVAQTGIGEGADFVSWALQGIHADNSAAAVDAMKGMFSLGGTLSQADIEAQRKANDDALAKAVIEADTVQAKRYNDIRLKYNGMPGADWLAGRTTGVPFKDELGSGAGGILGNIHDFVSTQIPDLPKLEDYTKGMTEAAAAATKMGKAAHDSVKGLDDQNQAYAATIEERNRALQLRYDVMPEEHIAKLRSDLLDLHKAAGNIVDDQVVALWEKRFQEMELAADRTIGGKLLNGVWEFRNNFNDALAQMVVDSKFNFGQIAKEFELMLVRTSLAEGVTTPLFRAIVSGTQGLFSSASFSGTKAVTSTVGMPSSTFQVARGAAFLGGNPLPFAGGGVSYAPSSFPMANGGWGIHSEQKPEGIMPLTRIGGELGVKAVGSSVNIQVIDQHRAGDPVQVSEQRGPDGERMLRVMIRDEVGRMSSDGGMDQVLRPFGVSRRPR